MLELISKRSDFIAWRKSEDSEVGIVPTMGNLHEGHLSLIEASLTENDITVVTIFVNPKQFGPSEDYNKYPRTLDRDTKLLKSLIKNYSNRKLIIFAPKSIDDIYPNGLSTTIKVQGLQDCLCGIKRNGHFDGVTTVVYTLFNLVRPTRSYFGEKDFQQLLIIRKMTYDLELPIEVKSLPIKRDINGLALSSRNQFLNKEQRKDALTLSITLHKIKAKIEESGVLAANLLIREIKSTDKRFEYLDIRDSNTLENINDSLAQSNIVIAGAFNLGKTRLIDNLLLY